MMRNYGKSLLAGIMAMSGSLTAQNFPVTKETKEEIHVNLKNDSLKIVRGGFLAGADGELYSVGYYDEDIIPKEFKGGKVCSAIPGNPNKALYSYITQDTIIFLQNTNDLTVKEIQNPRFKIIYHLKDSNKKVVEYGDSPNNTISANKRDTTVHLAGRREISYKYKDEQGNIYTEDDIKRTFIPTGETRTSKEYYYQDNKLAAEPNITYIISNQDPILSEVGKKEIEYCKAYIGTHPGKKIRILVYNASKKTQNLGCDDLLKKKIRQANNTQMAIGYIDALALRNALKAHADKLVEVIRKEMGPAYKNQIEYVNAYDKYQEFSYPKGDDGKPYPAGSGFVIVYPKTEIVVEEETIQEIPYNIVDIQQQIIDLLCIAGKTSILESNPTTIMGEMTIRAVPDNAGIDNIYFRGEHILTVVRSNSPGAKETMKSITIPVVSKETLIKARNYLEEAMLVYHYGGKEQKGYYLPMDLKYIRSLGKLVSREGYQEPKVDPSKKLITAPHSEYMESWENSPNSYVQEYYCKSLTCELHNVLVMNPEDCLKLINPEEQADAAKKEAEAKAARDAELATIEKARQRVEEKIKKLAEEAEREAGEKVKKDAGLVAKEKTQENTEEAGHKMSKKNILREETVNSIRQEELVQQILDLLCLSGKVEEGNFMVGDKIRVDNDCDKCDRLQLTHSKIFFKGRPIINQYNSKEWDQFNSVSGETDISVRNKILEKTRDYLEKELGFYPYGGKEQKGYYVKDPITGDTKLLGGPINCEEYYKISGNKKNLSVYWNGKLRLFNCDSLPKNCYFQESDDDGAFIVYKAQDCFVIGENIEKKEDPKIKLEEARKAEEAELAAKEQARIEAEEKAKKEAKEVSPDSEILELQQQILDLICLSGKLESGEKRRISIGSKIVVTTHLCNDCKNSYGIDCIYFDGKHIFDIVRDPKIIHAKDPLNKFNTISENDKVVSQRSNRKTLIKARDYLEKELRLFHYNSETSGRFRAGKRRFINSLSINGLRKTRIAFPNHQQPIDSATNLHPNDTSTINYWVANKIILPGYDYKWQNFKEKGDQTFQTLVVKAENCLSSKKIQEKIVDPPKATKEDRAKAQKEAELAAKAKARQEATEAKKAREVEAKAKKETKEAEVKEKKEAEAKAKEQARQEAEETKKEMEATKKARETEEQAEAKTKKEAEAKAKEEAESKNVASQDAERLRELMLRFLKVLECEGRDNAGEAREARLRLKDAIGNDVKCILEYDPDISGIANNRHDHLQDANKTVTFKRKGKEYTLSMTFDPEHKAKLYDSRDGSKFAFETSDHEFAFWFGEKFGKNVYKMGTYDGETGKQDINDAASLLEEILKSNTCAENIQPKKAAPAELTDKPKEEQVAPTKAEIKAKQEQIKKTEKEMNEIFEYGQKVIFVDNRSTFNRNHVEEGLDKLYVLLQKNSSLTIKVTGYFGGSHPTLPLERAEKVRDYLVGKGIDEERIHVAGGKEKIAKSIRIEIVE